MIVEERFLGWNNIPIKSKEAIYPKSKDDKAPKKHSCSLPDEKLILYPAQDNKD